MVPQLEAERRTAMETTTPLPLRRTRRLATALSPARDAAPSGQGYRNHRAPASYFPKREASSGCVSVVKGCGYSPYRYRRFWLHGSEISVK
jgi:hypothetical protein